MKLKNDNLKFKIIKMLLTNLELKFIYEDDPYFPGFKCFIRDHTIPLA